MWACFARHEIMLTDHIILEVDPDPRAKDDFGSIGMLIFDTLLCTSARLNAPDLVVAL